jgi:hypothetical protein
MAINELQNDNPGLGASGYRQKLCTFVQDVMRAQSLDTANADARTSQILAELGFSGAFTADDKVRGNEVGTILQRLLAPPKAPDGQPDKNERVYGSVYTQAEFLKLPAEKRNAIFSAHEHATTHKAKEEQRQKENSIDVRDLPANWDAKHDGGAPVYSPESKLRWLEERRTREAEQRKAVQRIVATVGA